ncbi:collagen alpha-2(I) chain-like [Myotis daubentonii]|uniref:collagen alpha-2(I) chain-like n=1 Tax=Myotis daubentonii TaxID=98922 RepID=UPI002873CD3C|nr:collagen alpha-2(I) chain-like [Myotis daubentonii]
MHPVLTCGTEAGTRARPAHPAPGRGPARPSTCWCPGRAGPGQRCSRTRQRRAQLIGQVSGRGPGAEATGVRGGRGPEVCGPEAGGARGPPQEDSADRAVTGPPEGRAPAGPRALQQGLSAGLAGRIYLRAAAAASPSHGLCRPPLSGSSRLRRRGLPSEAGARPRAARTHTPTPRAPPPPACRSASRTQRGPHWARAPRSRPPPRSPLPLLPGAGSREGVRAPARTTPVPPRRGGRARERGGHPTLGTRSRCGRSGRARPGPRAGPQKRVWARGARARRGHPSPFRPPADLPSGGQVCEGRWGRTPGASSLARAEGACGKRSASAGPRGGAARAGRPGVGPAVREAAPFVRVSEPCLQAVQLPRRPRRRAGCAHLGRRIPCPAGAVVSPLKQPAPHCSGTAAAGSRGARTWPLPPARVLLDGRTRGLVESPDQAGAGREAAGPGFAENAAAPSGRRSALSARSPGQRGAVSSSGTRTVRPSVSYPDDKNGIMKEKKLVKKGKVDSHHAMRMLKQLCGEVCVLRN